MQRIALSLMVMAIMTAATVLAASNAAMSYVGLALAGGGGAGSRELLLLALLCACAGLALGVAGLLLALRRSARGVRALHLAFMLMAIAGAADTAGFALLPLPDTADAPRLARLFGKAAVDLLVPGLYFLALLAAHRLLAAGRVVQRSRPRTGTVIGVARSAA